jgi:hypothetical protein
MLVEARIARELGIGFWKLAVEAIPHNQEDHRNSGENGDKFEEHYRRSFREPVGHPVNTKPQSPYRYDEAN